MTTTTYSFEFENDNRVIHVRFVDSTKSIDMAEALAQIGHADRRAWAKRTIMEMIQSNALFMRLTFSNIKECPFEKRLMDEKWNKSVVALMYTNTHHMLYLFRLYSFNLFISILCVHA